MDDVLGFGVRLDTFDKLAQTLAAIWDDKTWSRSQREAKALYHKYWDGGSSERLWMIIRKIIEGKL